MSYVEKELYDGEQIVYMGRMSTWTIIPGTLLAIAILVVATVIAYFAGALVLLFWLITVPIVLLLWLLTVARRMFRIATTEFAITNRRVMSKTGMFNTEVKATPLDKVNNINVSQSFFGNMLDYGDVEVTTATAEENDNHGVSSLAHPDKFRNRLSQEMDTRG
jgi:uncharacterized membrane protein YdbT with pleckstrin-like domain